MWVRAPGDTVMGRLRLLTVEGGGRAWWDLMCGNLVVKLPLTLVTDGAGAGPLKGVST